MTKIFVTFSFSLCIYVLCVETNKKQKKSTDFSACDIVEERERESHSITVFLQFWPNYLLHSRVHYLLFD